MITVENVSKRDNVKKGLSQGFGPPEKLLLTRLVPVWSKY